MMILFEKEIAEINLDIDSVIIVFIQIWVLYRLELVGISAYFRSSSLN